MATTQQDALDALEMIREEGLTVPIHRVVDGAFDPVTSETTPGADLVGNLTAVILPASKGVSSFDNNVPEALRNSELRKVLAAAIDVSFPPRAGDFLSFENKRWKILGVDPLAPNGIPIIYTIGCVLS